MITQSVDGNENEIGVRIFKMADDDCADGAPVSP